MKHVIDQPLETDRMVLNYGPHHPATHGTLRIIMELEGETVTKVTPEIGFLHSGFEKLGEDLNFNQYITITDRMNYLSPLCNNVAYALAAEKLMDLEVSKRTEYIRVLMCELSRIADHLLNVGMLAVDLGAMTAFLYGFRVREDIYDLFEKATGTRLTTSYTLVGGLMRDIPEGFDKAVLKVLDEVDEATNDIETLLNKNRIWHDRTKNIGIISKEDAISYGISGPMARASGIDWDIRVNEPYSSYQDFDFDVAIALNGDVFDRYLVRMEEIRQSIKICRQSLDEMPTGDVIIDPSLGLSLPPKDEVYNTIEGLIYHFEITMPHRGMTPPVGEAYVPTESPNGELGYYIVSDGKRTPYRVRTRPPSLINYSIFSKLIEGHMLSDAPAIIGSINVIAGELDR
ncbi:MAG TPA: NADH dehydrogenase (quinone) subunit D [Candidatus Marinimicrobia bacterium]|nr:NADH dehydrogenase (quinone) subunit D [Candidatus Neomarinimicrobiota bacterium]MDP7126568.1 NADH dehydrogenase (quinone) subunit D [Candidatus Neomarinimicrobiota bacterium]HJL78491.1 NADH dehydrogenase (quinone) subunit D [Candidatus Neomarinimicrobiota bacterium]HJN67857.1 NADH dehydrogenase (quinone) subunit D [Candidatus Neomarinimicrobiota bacterium]